MSNDFKTFATSGTANVYTNAEYIADADTTNGNQPGIAKSKLVNKALRQCSIISTVVAQYIADITGTNAVDDGTTATLLTNLKTATDVAYNINGATSKTTPVDADEFAITDSAATFGLKKLTWANLKATLVSYFSSRNSTFSAYCSSAQTITTATVTKISLQAENFDTNNAFDSTTNYRFQPTVAGYYQFNGNIEVAATATITRGDARLYKNGSSYIRGSDIFNNGNALGVVVGGIIPLNGTTDYVELYGQMTSTGTITTVANSTTLSGTLVREL